MNARIGDGTLFCQDGRVFHQRWNETPGILYFNDEPLRFPSDPAHGTSVEVAKIEIEDELKRPKEESPSDGCKMSKRRKK